MLFLLWADESIYGQLFEDRRKSYFGGRDEYNEMVNGAYEILVCTSRKYDGSIPRGVICNFRSKRSCDGRTSVMFTQ